MSGRCESCEVLMINGLRCHEHGCPDAWRDEERECRECGSTFEPEERRAEFCSNSCYCGFYGMPCEGDCEEVEA